MIKNLLKGKYGAFKVVSTVLLLFFSFELSAQCSVQIAVDTDINCFGDSTGSLTLAGTITRTPLMITEVDRNSPDLIEIQNVTGAPFNTTGYYIICSDDYSNINTVNTLSWDLTGVQAAGWINYRDDAIGTNYWGNNLFFNGTDPGWVAICDASNNVVDIIFWGWTAVDIATFAPIFNGNTITMNPSMWTGNGVGTCNSGSMARSTNVENDDATDWTCTTGANAGVSNITITATSSSGIASLVWSTGETTDTISNLPAGIYTVTATDSTGCISSDTFDFTGPALITANAILNDVVCNGDNTGSAVVTGSGGLGSISINWGSNIPTQLPEGYVTFVMTDDSACAVTDSVYISEPAVISPNLSTQSTPCFGDITGGSATASPSGGVPGYFYSWSNDATTSTVSNANVGLYTVVVTDANGCSVTDAISVVSPDKIDGNLIAQSVLCFGGSTGEIDALPSGGNPAYTYSWSTGATTSSINSLSSGWYSLSITDNNSCVVVDSIEVLDPPLLELTSIVHEENNGSDGSINITVVGGVMPYSYSWTNGPNPVEDVFGLDDGTYAVTVVDSNGCVLVDSFVVMAADTSVGLRDLERIEFSVIPNPNNGVFEVSFNQYLNTTSIEVVNSIGQVVYFDNDIKSGHRVNLNNIETGVYFVRLFNEEVSNQSIVLIK